MLIRRFEIGKAASPRADEVFISRAKDCYVVHWYVNRKPFDMIKANGLDEEDTMECYYYMVKRVMEVWDGIYTDQETS